jgi:hypothetical protein
MGLLALWCLTMAAGPVELPASAVAALANFGMKVALENILGLYAVEVGRQLCRVFRRR